MEKLLLISTRDNSSIWVVDDTVFGRCVYKEIYNQIQLPSTGVLESYDLYFSLLDTKRLVKIHKAWIVGSKVCVLMEHLDGWVRIGKEHYSDAVRIVHGMVSQGVIDWDLSFLNFMVSPLGEVKMVDLDRLIKIDTLPECPGSANWILTWFGSRIIKMMKDLC